MRKVLSLLFVSLFLAGTLLQPLVVAGQENVEQDDPRHLALNINEVEPNNTKETAQSFTTIGAANPINAEFDSVSDQDWFKFTAEAGQMYVVETFNAAGAINTNQRSLQLKVFDSDSTKIAEDIGDWPNGSANVNSTVAFKATNGGIYYIQIYHYTWGNRGPYSIRVLPKYDKSGSTWDENGESNHWCETAFELKIGSKQAISTTVEASNSSYLPSQPDHDCFRFETVKDQVYVIETFNVAGAINTANRPMQMIVYDSDFTKVKEDTSTNVSNGSANTNASVEFVATKGGVYFIVIHPYFYYWTDAGSGPYNIRILPKFDQLGANWDEDEEPNNWATHAFKLTLGRTQAISTSVEARNSSYLPAKPDHDWFRFQVTAGQSYVLETFNVAGAINPAYHPMQLQLYNSEFSLIDKDTQYWDSQGKGNTNASVEFVATKNDTYYALIHPYFYYWTDPGAGPYYVRLLPRYDQPEATWDENEEPNNWFTHSFPLQIGRLQAVESNIESRDPSYLTDSNDLDVFRFEAIKDQSYVVETFHVAGAVNRDKHPLIMKVYDKDDTLIKADENYWDSTGSGNTNAGVEFVATKGGSYFVAVYPQVNGAGSGPYSIRVLPQYNQPQANWDASFEPNNWGTHAYPLELNPCGRMTTIEARNSSYLTDSPDRDWFSFPVEQGKEYILDVYEIAGRFGNRGLKMELYDNNWSKIDEASGTGNQGLQVKFTANVSGNYAMLIFPLTDTNGTYRLRVTPLDGEGCPGGRPLPQIDVEGCASIGMNTETGEVTLRGTPRSGCPHTFTRLVKCENSANPQDVQFRINDKSFPMTPIGNSKFSVVVDTGKDLPPGNGPFTLKVTFVCGNTNNSTTVGTVVLFDPSGVISDSQTNQPIQEATVVLHRVPGAIPDKAGQSGDCRTIDTRGGGNWEQVPSYTVNAIHRINPEWDAINNTQQISPTINPQITGIDGSYAWDVVPGCWYIEVGATGYLSTTSPLVGIPPAVTDLNIQLEKAPTDRKVFLPLVNR